MLRTLVCLCAQPPPRLPLCPASRMFAHQKLSTGGSDLSPTVGSAAITEGNRPRPWKGNRMSCLRPVTDPFRIAAPIADDILLGRRHQGVRLAHVGRVDEAIATLEHPRHDLPHRPLSEMAPVLPGLLVNLGLAQRLGGRFGSAEKNLYTARQLAEERALPLLELAARHNLGCLALHRNDASSRSEERRVGKAS